MLDRLMLSSYCGRCRYRSFASSPGQCWRNESEIENAITAVRALRARVDCDGQVVLAHHMPADGSVPGAQVQISITRLEVQAADELEEALVACERILWTTFTVPIMPTDAVYGDFHQLLRILGLQPDVEPVSFNFHEGVGEFVTIRATSAEKAREGVRAAAGQLWPQDQPLQVGQPTEATE